MAYYRDRYLLGYIYSRARFGGKEYSYIRKKMFFRALCLLPFVFLPVRVINKKIMVSGNSNRRFFSGLDDSIGYFGLGLTRDYLNTSALYVSAFLYSFASRKFVFLYRRVVAYYRKKLSLSDVKVIVVHSDALPLVRALMQVAKPLKIKFVCVQHGFFHKENFSQLDGSLCDLNIVASKQQREIFIKSGIYNTRINKYSACSNFDSAIDVPVKGVCLVSSGLVFDYKDQHEIEYKYFQSIRDECAAARLLVRYRPHPRERSSLKFMVKNFFNYGKSFYRISPNYVYIGGHSSFLRELASMGIKVLIVDTVSSVNTFDELPADAVGLSVLLKFISRRFENVSFLQDECSFRYNVKQIVDDYFDLA